MDMPSGASAPVGASGKSRSANIGTIVVPERVKIIFDMISHAAERGDECPSNAILATGAGCSKEAAIDAVKLLETLNVLQVQRGRNWRVATIIGTPYSTKVRGTKVRIAAAPSTNSGGPTASARQASADVRAANRRKRIALFCDALSCGTPDEPVTIKQAGIVAGVSEPTARSFMDEVKRDLGRQAQ